jgi:hypothetical protein
MKKLLATLSCLVRRGRGAARSGQNDVRLKSADQAAGESARRLEACAGVWKTTPGLLLDVSGAGIAAIVRYRRSKSDDLGFRLEIEVEEPLMVPKGLRTGDTIELNGNWGDAAFSVESVSLPGSFAIYFGEEGVGRVRQFWAVLPLGKKRRPAPRPLFGTLQQCFRVGRPGGISEKEFEKRLKMFAPAAGERTG